MYVLCDLRQSGRIAAFQQSHHAAIHIGALGVVARQRQCGQQHRKHLITHTYTHTYHTYIHSQSKVKYENTSIHTHIHLTTLTLTLLTYACVLTYIHTCIHTYIPVAMEFVLVPQRSSLPPQTEHCPRQHHPRRCDPTYIHTYIHIQFTYIHTYIQYILLKWIDSIIIPSASPS
jgi:hypothetical protein